MLGICRGAQALNVARGGTLHQHLPGHRQTEPATATTHTVHVEPARGCRRSSAPRPLRVNSFHHQAVDVARAAACARSRTPPTARSRRSRRPGPRFVLGVQWHAEGLVAQPRHRALFEALVPRAAGARAPAALRAAVTKSGG